VSLAISYVLAYYTDIELALTAFAICTALDSLTRIAANAKKKGLVFNPFLKEFWKEINSQGLRNTMEKVFLQYGVYLIIAFVIDILVFKQLVIFNIYDRPMTLPVIALYLFTAIEIWSIGENIEDAGFDNIFKRILQFLPDKVQQIFKKTV